MLSSTDLILLRSCVEKLLTNALAADDSLTLRSLIPLHSKLAVLSKNSDNTLSAKQLSDAFRAGWRRLVLNGEGQAIALTNDERVAELAPTQHIIFRVTEILSGRYY